MPHERIGLLKKNSWSGSVLSSATTQPTAARLTTSPGIVAGGIHPSRVTVFTLFVHLLCASRVPSSRRRQQAAVPCFPPFGRPLPLPPAPALSARLTPFTGPSCCGRRRHTTPHPHPARLGLPKLPSALLRLPVVGSPPPSLFSPNFRCPICHVPDRRGLAQSGQVVAVGTLTADVFGPMFTRRDQRARCHAMVTESMSTCQNRTEAKPRHRSSVMHDE